MQFPDHPGHFPGNPLVPGAALLAAAAAQLGLAGVERVRFLVPVRPGEALELRHRAEGGRVWFAWWRGDVEVVRGVGWG